MSKDLSWEEFKQRLLAAGWTEKEADEEIERLKTEEPESEL
jgi:hypothetical protein